MTLINGNVPLSSYAASDPTSKTVAAKPIAFVPDPVTANEPTTIDFQSKGVGSDLFVGALRSGNTYDLVMKTLEAGNNISITEDNGALRIDAGTSSTFIGASNYSATFSGGVISETIGGVPVVSTISGSTITAVYGSPLNQTWVTTISGGTVTTVRTA